MTRSEKYEAAVLATASAGWIVLAPTRWSAPAGVVIGTAAGILLAQGLVRDVLKLVARRSTQADGARRIMCLCAESTIGLVLVVVGGALAAAGLNQPVTLGHWSVAASVPLILAFGFVAKDYVVSIRRETDHASVLVW